MAKGNTYTIGEAMEAIAKAGQVCEETDVDVDDTGAKLDRFDARRTVVQNAIALAAQARVLAPKPAQGEGSGEG